MQIKITGSKLPKFQEEGLFNPIQNPNITGDKGFGRKAPTAYTANIAIQPIGYDEDGKPVFPQGSNVPPWGVEFGKHKGNITATKQDAPFKLEDWKKDMEKKFPQFFPKEQTTVTQPSQGLSSIQKATLLTTGLRGLGNILSKQQDANRREEYRIESGRTDSYFPTVPNVYSRGTEEINTGEFMPNLRTPVQFPGIPAAEYYGMQQYQVGGGIDMGAYIPGTSSLLPAMPASFNETVDFGYPIAATPVSEKSAVTSSPELETTIASRGFALPAAPYVFRLASGFGPRKAPKPGASTMHNGSDMGMPIDTPLFSVKDGIVKKVYEDGKGGKQIVIFHPDGTRSGYAHLNAFNVKEGDQVRMGQQIGLSGNTGISTGPHLHFTYGYHDGKKTTQLVDPNSVFKFTEYAADKKPKNTEVNKLATKILNIVEDAQSPVTQSFVNTGARRNVFGGAIFSNSTPIVSDNTSNIVNSETNSEVSYTHKNPLNIHWSKGGFAEQYGGIKGAPDQKGFVAKFPSFDVGVQAAKDLLFGPSYINLNIEEARNRWVTGDPKKSADSSKNIVKALGSNKKLSELTDAEKDKLIKEFIRWEGKDAYNAFKDFKFYEEGGIFELDDAEIDYILSNGGEIEYL